MIPQEVRHVLLTLERAGHEAYIVGGCVRDMLMENRPHDWDVTTSALPQETMALLDIPRSLPACGTAPSPCAAESWPARLRLSALMEIIPTTGIRPPWPLPAACGRIWPAVT